MIFQTYNLMIATFFVGVSIGMIACHLMHEIIRQRKNKDNNN